jgi:endonuclease/exonuclease/phosphatase family metal-dependent hydrolase
MSGGTKRRFSKPPVVVAGDLNSNSQWDANRPRTKSHGGSSLIRESWSNRLISAYHAHNGENQGNETRPTYYLYRYQHKSFHLDYVFVPKDWRLKLVGVGSFGVWGKLGDRVPVVVDVTIGGDQ